MICIDKDMVIIRRRAIKFEETTVTLQSTNPRKPMTNSPTNPLQERGKTTHRRFLKTIPRVNKKSKNKN